MNNFVIYEFSAYQNGEVQQYFLASEVLEFLAARATPAQPAPSPASVSAAILNLPLPKPAVTTDTHIDGKGHPAYTADQVRALIAEAAALAGQLGQLVPDNWQLVPKEPTAQMILAAEKADDEGFEAGRSYGASSYEIYEAMLAAAPSIPKDGQKSEGA